jgi:hypothetical protein
MWHLGPMKLTLSRQAREWCIDYVASDELREDGSVECPTSASLEGDGVVRHRFAFKESPGSIRVGPALADRPVVVYPESAFHVTAGESITLFCSTPLWVRVEADGDGGETLLETPIDRPSDSWFGPSSLQGELAYATKTKARLDRAGVPVRAHRAVTELRIDNRSIDTLRVERVNLIVPYLSLYAGPDGSLWTESVVLTRDTAETTGKVEIGSPPAGSSSERVTPPRLASEKGKTLVRAFSALFT